MNLLSYAVFIGMTISQVAAAKTMFEPISISSQTGWNDDNHAEALVTFQRSCQEILTTAHGFKRASAYGGSREDWKNICEQAMLAKAPKSFFEENFVAYRIHDQDRPQGLFTGYYEPEADGSLIRTKVYQVPVYRKPQDLIAFDEQAQSKLGLAYGRMIDGKPVAYPTRQAIEQGALDDKNLEICWLKSWADAFFIHIQGSGRVRLENGKTIRLAYAAKTGQPYTGIGAVLLDQGIGTKENMSMEFLRNWMQEHPTKARELMWHNKSYIFFREIQVPEENLGALGAQQVNLTPLRSLAVDRSLWMFGTPIFISTTTPPEAGSKPFRHLMIAQDTGTAIKGHVRGDIYWGWGEKAAFNAGYMKSAGTMIVLLPKPVASRLPR